MARHKDIEWNLYCSWKRGDSEHTHSDDSITLNLLMDIRDELRLIRAVLQCPNTQAIPKVLRTIASNTTKRQRAKLRKVA